MRAVRNHLGPLTHLLAAWSPVAWYVGISDHTLPLGLVILSAFFALLPDIDTGSSHLGRLFPWITKPLERSFGHRTITHSLFAIGLIAVVTSLLYPDGAGLLTLAYGSHLFVDMVVGETGIQLFWPAKTYIYFSSFRPAGTGEFAVALFLGGFLILPLIQPELATSLTNFVPHPPTSTPTHTPQPNLVSIRVEHVVDIEREILVAPGDAIERGQLVADLISYRARIATATPQPGAPASKPTLAAVDPLSVEIAKAKLDLARAQYQRAIATPTPNVPVITILEAQATTITGGILDRRNALYRCEQEGSCGEWRYQIAAQELLDLEEQSTRLTEQIRDARFPRGPSQLDIAVAASQLRVAEADYAAAIATPTPAPRPTSTSPAQIQSDETRIYSLVAGNVYDIRITSISGNEATVEIVIEIDSQDF